MPEEAILKISNLKKSFYSDFWKPKVAVLHDVSFSILRGQSVGFLGANGAGKTTTLKIILGLVKQDSGVVQFADSMGSSREQVLSNIGYLPERPYFYPHLTGWQYCHFVSKLGNLHPDIFATKLAEYAKDLSIDHALEKKLSSYSKGMLQRIGLVSALLHGPQMVFLDEPMSGLDPVGRKEIRDVIAHLKERGVTVFFSTHIVNDIEEICDSVVVLKQGHCLFNGPLELMYKQNSEILVTISYELNGELRRTQAPFDQVNQELTRLIGMGGQVKTVLNEHPKLEEIIYRIQESNRS